MQSQVERTPKPNLLVDWDGCIHKTLEVWLSATQSILKEFGIELPSEVVSAQIVPRLDNAGEFGIGPEQIEEFKLRVVTLAKENLAQAEIDKQLWEMLITLHDSGIRLAIVSNSSLADINDALQLNRLDASIFECVITPEETGLKRRPETDMLLLAVGLLGCSFTDVFMFGDSTSDILAAKTAGIQSIHWYPENNQKFYPAELPADKQPTFTVTSADDLQNFFLSNSHMLS